MADKHGWNSWDHYQNIHDRVIRDYLDHFILDDQLTPVPTADLIHWDGYLYCAGGVEIKVVKQQAVELRQGQPFVRTTRYAYHVYRRAGTQTLNLFRYDNVHPHPGHPDAHHRHQYGPDGVTELEPAQHIGESGWPTLGEVIEEAHKWWTAHGGAS